MSHDGKKLESYIFEDSVNSDVVIACFDKFSENLKCDTIVIIDNAPTHTSNSFKEKIIEWKKKGLFLKFLPAYSPELNKIEILWRFMKQKWIEFSSYSSYDLLKENICEILKLFGTKYLINFS